MPIFAGQKVTAPRVSWYEQSLLLPSPATQDVAGVFEDWGDPVEFANPGVRVSISGQVVGRAVRGSVGTGSTWVAVRLLISSDGGANYDPGDGPTATPAGFAPNRTLVMAQHHMLIVPTGDVMVKVQHASSDAAAEFYNGNLIARMYPA